MCETRDLGLKMPYWHTLVFIDEIKIYMRCVWPRTFKKCWYSEPDQCIGRSGQQSTNRKS